MSIYPGDRRDRFRTRRGVLFALAGILFLPSQGLLLARALHTGNAALWAAWAVVLTGLIVAAIAWIRDDRRRGRDAAPWAPGPLLLGEGAALLLGLLVTFLTR